MLLLAHTPSTHFPILSKAHASALLDWESGYNPKNFLNFLKSMGSTD